MKVKELIKELMKYNPDLDVEIEYAHFEEIGNVYEDIFDVVASDEVLYLRTEDASAYDDEE